MPPKPRAAKQPHKGALPDERRPHKKITPTPTTKKRKHHPSHATNPAHFRGRVDPEADVQSIADALAQIAKSKKRFLSDDVGCTQSFLDEGKTTHDTLATLMREAGPDRRRGSAVPLDAEATLLDAHHVIKLL